MIGTESKYQIGRLIGRGSFGNVFSDVTNQFAIKITKIFPEDIEETNKSYREYYINKNFLSHSKLFLKCLEATKKDSFELNLKREKYTGPCLQLVFEKGDGTLDDYFNVPRTSKECCSCILQLLGALHYLQTKYQLVHSDIKASNIVFKRVPLQSEIIYEIFGKKYIVSHTGVLFYIIDFGVASSLSPSYNMYWKSVDGSRSFGTRSIEIADEMAVYNGNKNILGTKRGTEKNFIGTFLSNPVRFPPYEFTYDVQDCLKIFLGGKRATSPKIHSGIRIPDDFRKTLETKLLRNVLKPYHILAGKLFEEIILSNINANQKNRGFP